MPQYDLYHETVKTALQKNGWRIINDPFIIEYQGLRLYADLGVQKKIPVTEDDQKIVVEIKSFNSLSLITELEKAIGQYIIYRTLLKFISCNRKLYLAVPNEVFLNFFQRPAIQAIITDQQIDLLVFNPKTEEIIQWIS